MARRAALTAAAATAVMLIGSAYATGGLRTVPKPQPRRPEQTLDLGRYAVAVTGAVLHRQAGGLILDVTLRVKSKDRRSVLLQDLAVNALALESAGGPVAKPISATAYSKSVDVNMLHPGVPVTVVLTYGLTSAAVPSGFRARLVFWGYDHREDFFYGHTQWKPRKPADAGDDQPAEFEVSLPIRREGV
jgi:hypothetical protein